MVHKRLETSEKVGGKQRDDFVALFLNEDDTHKSMNLLELEANINDLLFAGSETSSTALTGITNFLLQDPSELATLIHEIRTAFPHESDMTMSAVHELRYLGAVIEEGLRLAPPVPEGLARIVAPEGQFVAGHWIPGHVRHPLPFSSTSQSVIPHKANPPLLLDPRLRPSIQRQPFHPVLRLPCQLPPVTMASSQRSVAARFQPVLARPSQLHRKERGICRDAAHAGETAVGVRYRVGGGRVGLGMPEGVCVGAAVE